MDRARKGHRQPQWIKRKRRVGGQHQHRKSTHRTHDPPRARLPRVPKRPLPRHRRPTSEGRRDSAVDLRADEGGDVCVSVCQAGGSWLTMSPGRWLICAANSSVRGRGATGGLKETSVRRYVHHSAILVRWLAGGLQFQAPAGDRSCDDFPRRSIGMRQGRTDCKHRLKVITSTWAVSRCLLRNLSAW